MCNRPGLLSLPEQKTGPLIFIREGIMTTTAGSTKQQQGAGAEAQQPQARRDPHILQQKWLAAARGKGIEILLMNGHIVQGVLVGNDQFVLWLKEESGQVAMLYKHACSVLRRTAGEGENGKPEQ
jgi:RNA chaperone Hfq